MEVLRQSGCNPTEPLPLPDPRGDPQFYEDHGGAPAVLEKINEWTQIKLDEDEERTLARTAAHVAELLRTDPTLDPSEKLLMEHFHHTRRLQILLLPQESQQDAAAVRVRAKPADIRLLSARKLISAIDGGGRMVIRQRLEAERPDIFLKA